MGMVRLKIWSKGCRFVKIFCQMVVLGMKARFYGKKPGYLMAWKPNFGGIGAKILFMAWKLVFGMRANFCGVKAKFWFCGMRAKILWHGSQNFVCGMGANFLFVWCESQVLWYGSRVFLKPSFVLSAWKPDFLFLAWKLGFCFVGVEARFLVFCMKARFWHESRVFGIKAGFLGFQNASID